MTTTIITHVFLHVILCLLPIAAITDLHTGGMLVKVGMGAKSTTPTQGPPAASSTMQGQSGNFIASILFLCPF